MSMMKLLTNLASMRGKLHIVSIKDRFNANDIHFCFNWCHTVLGTSIANPDF